MASFEDNINIERGELELSLYDSRLLALSRIRELMTSANKLSHRIEQAHASDYRFSHDVMPDAVAPVRTLEATLVPTEDGNGRLIVINRIGSVAMRVPSAKVALNESPDIGTAFLSLASSDAARTVEHYLLTEGEYRPYASSDDLEEHLTNRGEPYWRVKREDLTALQAGVSPEEYDALTELRSEALAITALQKILDTYLLRAQPQSTQPSGNSTAAA